LPVYRYELKQDADSPDPLELVVTWEGDPHVFSIRFTGPAGLTGLFDRVDVVPDVQACSTFLVGPPDGVLIQGERVLTWLGSADLGFNWCFTDCWVDLARTVPGLSPGSSIDPAAQYTVRGGFAVSFVEP
jgi:hypothetical protein